MMSSGALLLEGSSFFGALYFRPPSCSSVRATTLPKKPVRGDQLSQALLRRSPRATCSSSVKKLRFVTIKWSKHWPTLHCSAEGFQLSCAGVSKPKTLRASSVIEPSCSRSEEHTSE